MIEEILQFVQRERVISTIIMFTALQNTIIGALRIEPKYKPELAEEISEKLGFTERGVKGTVTRMEKANLIGNNKGILTLTKDGLISVETQSNEFEMSARLARGRRL